MTSAAEASDRVMVRARDRTKTLHEIRCAILRVKSKGLKISISAVAREAGVVPSLLHNTYPEIAEEIREQMGRSTRAQRDEKTKALAEAKRTIGELRRKLASAEADIAKLASINKSLNETVATLTAATTGKVVVLPKR